MIRLLNPIISNHTIFLELQQLVQSLLINFTTISKIAKVLYVALSLFASSIVYPFLILHLDNLIKKNTSFIFLIVFYILNFCKGLCLFLLLFFLSTIALKVKHNKIEVLKRVKYKGKR